VAAAQGVCAAEGDNLPADLSRGRVYVCVSSAVCKTTRESAIRHQRRLPPIATFPATHWSLNPMRPKMSLRWAAPSVASGRRPSGGHLLASGWSERPGDHLISGPGGAGGWRRKGEGVRASPLSVGRRGPQGT
jgi:hypothetical protein